MSIYSNALQNHCSTGLRKEAGREVVPLWLINFLDKLRARAKGIESFKRRAQPIAARRLPSPRPSTEIGPFLGNTGPIIHPAKPVGKMKKWPWIVGSGAAATTLTTGAVLAGKKQPSEPAGALGRSTEAPNNSGGSNSGGSNGGGEGKENSNALKYAIYGGVPLTTAITGAALAGEENRGTGAVVGGIAGVPIALILDEMAKKHNLG